MQHTGELLEPHTSPCAGPYKDTVNLPVTKFNMRANSVQREPELQRQWAEQRTYEQLRDGNPGVSPPRLLDWHHGILTCAAQGRANSGQPCWRQCDANFSPL